MNSSYGERFSDGASAPKPIRESTHFIPEVCIDDGNGTPLSPLSLPLRILSISSSKVSVVIQLRVFCGLMLLKNRSMRSPWVGRVGNASVCKIGRAHV